MFSCSFSRRSSSTDGLPTYATPQPRTQKRLHSDSDAVQVKYTIYKAAVCLFCTACRTTVNMNCTGLAVCRTWLLRPVAKVFDCEDSLVILLVACPFFFLFQATPMHAPIPRSLLDNMISKDPMVRDGAITAFSELAVKKPSVIMVHAVKVRLLRVTHFVRLKYFGVLYSVHIPRRVRSGFKFLRGGDRDCSVQCTPPLLWSKLFRRRP